MESLCVVNLSKRVTVEDALTMVDASSRLLQQVCLVWGLQESGLIVPYLPVNLYTDLSSLPVFDTDPVFIMDAPTDADALGEHFHTLTPAARIFVNPVLDEGDGVVLFDEGNPQRLTVASVLFHELAEMTVDPNLDRYAKDAAGNVYDLEISDPVERNNIITPAQMPWGIVSVALSDFVTPDWFRAGSAGPYNYGTDSPVSAPFTLDHGGYAVVNGDQTFARRADGRVVYPDSWRLAQKMIHGRAARRDRTKERVFMR